MAVCSSMDLRHFADIVGFPAYLEGGGIRPFHPRSVQCAIGDVSRLWPLPRLAFGPGKVPTHHHEFALAAGPDGHHRRHLVREDSEHGWKVAKAEPACLVLLNAAANRLLAEAPSTEQRSVRMSNTTWPLRRPLSLRWLNYTNAMV